MICSNRGPQVCLIAMFYGSAAPHSRRHKFSAPSIGRHLQIQYSWKSSSASHSLFEHGTARFPDFVSLSVLDRGCIKFGGFVDLLFSWHSDPNQLSIPSKMLFQLSAITCFAFITTTNAYVRAQRAVQVLDSRSTYQGGWPLALAGSASTTCPSEAPTFCGTASDGVNPSCCPSGQTCTTKGWEYYCCPTGMSPFPFLLPLSFIA